MLSMMPSRSFLHVQFSISWVFFYKSIQNHKISRAGFRLFLIFSHLEIVDGWGLGRRGWGRSDGIARIVSDVRQVINGNIGKIPRASRGN